MPENCLNGFVAQQSYTDRGEVLHKIKPLQSITQSCNHGITQC